MGATGSGGRRFSGISGSWHALRWPAAAGAWLLIGLIAIGGLVSAADAGSRRLHVTRDVSGTVTVLNFDASKFCVDEDVTGEQFCSGLYQRVGSAPLAIGQHVTGTVARLPTGPSSAMEAFILTDPLPTP